MDQFGSITHFSWWGRSCTAIGRFIHRNILECDCLNPSQGWKQLLEGEQLRGGSHISPEEPCQDTRGEDLWAQPLLMPLNVGSSIFLNTLSRIRWLWPGTFCLLLMKGNRSVEKYKMSTYDLVKSMAGDSKERKPACGTCLVPPAVLGSRSKRVFFRTGV